jgi:hypothetical protein
VLTTNRPWRLLAALLTLVLLVGGAAACSDDDDDTTQTGGSGGSGESGQDDDQGDDPDDDVGEVAESAAARGVAEIIRLALFEDDGPDTDRRKVEVLQESVDDIPGSPDVSGIADEDGDGLDDDGNVEVRFNDEVACLTVAEDGEVDVTGGAC